MDESERKRILFNFLDEALDEKIIAFMVEYDKLVESIAMFVQNFAKDEDIVTAIAEACVMLSRLYWLQRLDELLPARVVALCALTMADERSDDRTVRNLLDEYFKE